MRIRCFALAVMAALVLLPAGARARSAEGFGVSGIDLVETRLVVGAAQVEIHARPGVDVRALVAELDLAKSMTADAISAAVDARRLALYAGEPIVLAIAPARGAKTVAGEKAGLVKAIYWWDNEVCSSCYWYAQYTSTVAVLFLHGMEYGEFDVSDRYARGNWVYRANVSRGDAYSRTTYGTRQLRGFRGDSVDVDSKADIVMYFFK